MVLCLYSFSFSDIFEIFIHAFISVIFVMLYVCKFSKLSKCLNSLLLGFHLFIVFRLVFSIAHKIDG